MPNIYLKVPSIDELHYRQEWMKDPKTMSYNAGYDMDYSYNALLELEKVAFEKNNISELSDIIPLDRIGAIKTFKKAGFIHTELEKKELVFGKESIGRQLIITKEMYYIKINI